MMFRHLLSFLAVLSSAALQWIETHFFLLIFTRKTEGGIHYFTQRKQDANYESSSPWVPGCQSDLEVHMSQMSPREEKGKTISVS